MEDANGGLSIPERSVPVVGQKISTSNKVFLMKRLFNMKISEGGSVVDHLNEFNTLTSQLRSIKVNFDDEVRDFLLMFSLPKS